MWIAGPQEGAVVRGWGGGHFLSLIPEVVLDIEPGRGIIPGIPAPPLGMVLGSGLALRPLASRRALSSHQPILIKFLLYVGQRERAKPIPEGG